ncbi:MAG: TM1812 family CRISPR-associated protein [Bacillota bacterium]|nr:TM1812 family CRISPR-associated protein [Bacillota bacterium]
MTRKVLIGVLSKRKTHNSVVYEKDNGFSTKFTTTVCVPHVEPDEIFAVVTEPKEDDTEENKNLYENFKIDLKREEVKYTNNVHPIWIKNNVDNDEQLKTIYQELYDKVQDGDEIYLDITGGFRPIPLVLVEVIHYVQQIKKNVVLKEVYYGEYDWEKKEAAFHEVGYFLDLTEWAIGVQNYVQYADASYLKKIVRSDPKFEKGVALQLVENLDLFSQYLKVCQWKDAKELYETKISKEMDEFFGRVIPNSILESNRLKDLESLLRSKFESYKKNPIRGSVLWCEEHGNYQQALTLLNEFFKEHLVKCGYVKENEDFSLFKKMNDNWTMDCWNFRKEKRKLKDKEIEVDCVYSCVDNDFLFLLELRSYLSTYCDFDHLTYKDLSLLVDIKLKNHDFYSVLEDLYASCKFEDAFKTLDWYLAYLIKDPAEKLTKDLRQELADKMDVKNRKIKDFDHDINVKQKDWVEKIQSQITVEFTKDLQDLFRQYKNCSYVLSKLKNQLKEAEKEYVVIAKVDLNNDKVPLEKKKRLPFKEAIGTEISEKFIQNKEQLFQLFLDWNKVREYRNFMDHAQTLDKYSNFNYIKEKEKPEFKALVNRLLGFIETKE